MKNLFTLFLISLPLFGFGQSEQGVDPRLAEALGQSFVNHLVANNTDVLLYYTVYLDHGWEIKPFPDGKLADIPEITLTENEAEDDNILRWQKEYDLKVKHGAHSYYRLQNSNLVLTIFSVEYFAKIFNTVTGRTAQ